MSSRDDLLEAAAAVVRLHRDWGDRGNRRHARLKYVIAEHGEDWARERLVRGSRQDRSSRAGRCRHFAVPDHLGWHEQGDGRLYLGIPVASGRIVDGERARLRTALREIVAEFGVDPILMPSQDIILQRDPPRATATRSPQCCARMGCGWPRICCRSERWALACPALPTCGLALTEAERVRDDIVGAIAAAPGGRWGWRAGAAQHPHHRLPQWLRPALYRRYRHRRPDAGLLLALCRRRFRRDPAQHA